MRGASHTVHNLIFILKSTVDSIVTLRSDGHQLVIHNAKVRSRIINTDLHIALQHSYGGPTIGTTV